MVPVTKVIATTTFQKQLGRIPLYIQKKAFSWIRAVEIQGLEEVSKSRGLHDEPLKGKRLGQRSVRLNHAYRIIYRVLVDRVYIELLEVNKHEY